MDGLMMKYFVLKPHGNDQYARASRAAMRRYSKVIAGENPTLASDLLSWADREYADQFEDDGIEGDHSKAAPYLQPGAAAAREARMNDNRIEKVAKAARAAFYSESPMEGGWDNAFYKNSWRAAACAVIALLASEAPQPVVPGDVIREMLDRWYSDTDGMPPYDAAQVERMTAVASCLLARPEVLGPLTISELEFDKNVFVYQCPFNIVLEQRRSRLLTPVERVTIGDNAVFLDGKHQFSFDDREHAEIYATGLRARLKEGK